MYHITSIGEILFDIYPERKTLGGAPFNFIYHIIRFTGDGSFISRIGKDEEGQNILDFMKKNGLATEYIQIDSKHPTGESVANLNEMKVPSWEITKGTAYDFIEMSQQIESLITQETDCFYFGTLAQRNLTSRQTIHKCFNRDLKYFCDLNIRQDFYTKELITKCLGACNVLKLNIEELRLVNKLLLNKTFDSKETPKRILNEYNIDQLCVTYGEAGASIYKDNRNSYYKIKTENVVDTVGAGDAYAAILCLGYLNDWDIEKTNKIASEFSAETVKIEGALPKDPELYSKFKQIINE